MVVRVQANSYSAECNEPRHRVIGASSAYSALSALSASPDDGAYETFPQHTRKGLRQIKNGLSDASRRFRT